MASEFKKLSVPLAMSRIGRTGREFARDMQVIKPVDVALVDIVGRSQGGVECLSSVRFARDPVDSCDFQIEQANCPKI